MGRALVEEVMICILIIKCYNNNNNDNNLDIYSDKIFGFRGSSLL